MQLRKLLLLFFAAAPLACAASTSDDDGGLGVGAAAGTAGAIGSATCTPAAGCQNCGSCFERCFCATGQTDKCVNACVGSGVGGGSSGGGGNVGGSGAGTSSGGTPNTGGTPSSGGASSGGTPGSGGTSGGGNTGGGNTGGGGGTPSGACCTPTPGTPGCGITTISACVCAKDAYCCNTEWDQVCVNEVDSFGCGSCVGGGSGGTTNTGGTTGSGGSTSTGGTPGSGGTTSTGGTTGSGGFTAGSVTWIDWPAQHSQSNSGWSSYMTDVIRHLPTSYGSTYYDADKVTYVHETTHGINSHLRNYKNTTGKKANGFYVGHNKGVIIVEPNIWKNDANAYVPQSLRDTRYSLYMQGSQAWNDTPLYLWDEWVAYANGTEAGLNLVLEGKWTAGWRDVFGSMEFTVYAVALAMAVEAKDPSYFSSYAQFREFLKWNIERCMRLYNDTHNRTEFKWNKVDDYYNKIRTNSDAANMRAFLVKTYGATWTKNVMGF